MSKKKALKDIVRIEIDETTERAANSLLDALELEPLRRSVTHLQKSINRFQDGELTKQIEAIGKQTTELVAAIKMDGELGKTLAHLRREQDTLKQQAHDIKIGVQKNHDQLAAMKQQMTLLQERLEEELNQLARQHQLVAFMARPWWQRMFGRLEDMTGK